MGRRFGRLGAAVVLSFAAACTGASENAQTSQQPATALPEGHPPVSGATGSTATQGPGGVVLEKMDGGGYTYVRLGAGAQEIWVAGPITALEVGDTVALNNPMSMGKFTSKALDRTFDNLYFADAFAKPGATAGTPAPAPASGATQGPAQGVVAETMNSGGYTYIRATVDGKDVWLAGPQTTVKEGDNVRWNGGMVMRGFTSSTLQRTFEEILFVSAISVDAGG